MWSEDNVIVILSLRPLTLDPSNLCSMCNGKSHMAASSESFDSHLHAIRLAVCICVRSFKTVCRHYITDQFGHEVSLII